MKLKKKKSIQFDFAKVVELTEDELKTKVIGGQSLSAAEQYEIAQKAARGDYSGVEQVQSSSENNILDYGKETSNDTPKKSANIDEREKMDTVSKAPANIDEREKADSGGAEAVETSATASDKAKSGSLKSGSIDEREKNDTAVKVSNIDEREKRDGGSSSASGSNSTSSSGGTSSSNTSPYSFKKTSELNKESDQKYEMEVDYTKNGNDELAVTVRTQNEDGTYDYSHGKVMSKIYHNVTNNVKTPQQRGEPELYNGYYYYPQQFPDGSWNITEVEYKDNKDIFGTFAIRTDANVEVTKYNKDGTEIIGTTIDSGYLIHGGISPTTWGCLKMSDEENLWSFAGFTNFILDSGGTASINVMDCNISYK